VQRLRLLYHASGDVMGVQDAVYGSIVARDAWPSNGDASRWLNQPLVSVVVPAINEEENLRHVLPLIPSWVYEVILIDGNSTDGTVAEARRLVPDIRVVQQQGRGKGDALRCGFEAATGDIIVMLDADGSTDPREIPAYVGALVSGADFAKGSRFLQGGGTADMPVHRQLGNWGFVALVRACFGGSYTDICYGYNAFWRRVLPALDLDADGFEIEMQMNVRALSAGLRVAEIASFEDKRRYGEGGLRTFPDGWRVLKTLLFEASQRHRFSRRRIPEAAVTAVPPVEESHPKELAV
jgi:glycosyltransferase involved in cell wall biosynthesis